MNPIVAKIKPLYKHTIMFANPLIASVGKTHNPQSVYILTIKTRLTVCYEQGYRVYSTSKKVIGALRNFLVKIIRFNPCTMFLAFVLHSCIQW